VGYNSPKGCIHMKQRLISSFFGIILLVLVLLGNQQVFDVVVTGISAMGIYEVITAIGLKNFGYMKVIAIIFPFALTCVSYVSDSYYLATVFLFVALSLLGMLFNHEKCNFKTTALFIAVSVMISVSFFHMILVRRLGNENLDVLVILIGCWITDTCAYFTGYFLGKHKLAPKISPKKTIEGSIGGIVGVIVIIVAYAYAAGNIMNVSVNIVSAVFVGFVSGIVSQFGDLCASIIKRENGIKDFGNIMPGHGGVMDRFDSLLFVAPVVYYILKLFPIFV